MNGRAIVLAALLTVLAACGDDGRNTGPEEEPRLTSPCARAGTTPADPPRDARDYDAGLFPRVGSATNKWYPLQPGLRLDFRGSSVEDGERLQHTVEVIVTDLVKVVDGIPNRVVWERDYTEGELVEAELALFATDRHGNVWHTGEYPEEYEEGELVATPAWVHGIAGACAGITLPGNPRTGTDDYAQGFAPPPIAWVDRGQVHRTDQRTCVPVTCYDDVVVIAEFEDGVPEAFQDKYYAPGTGVVRVGWRGAKDESKEELELVRRTELTPAELAEARQQALALEERAYRISPEVWARTERSRPAG